MLIQGMWCIVFLSDWFDAVPGQVVHGGDLWRMVWERERLRHVGIYCGK